jgi:hypothetical protein
MECGAFELWAMVRVTVFLCEPVCVVITSTFSHGRRLTVEYRLVFFSRVVFLLSVTA